MCKTTDVSLEVLWLLAYYSSDIHAFCILINDLQARNPVLLTSLSRICSVAEDADVSNVWIMMTFSKIGQVVKPKSSNSKELTLYLDAKPLLRVPRKYRMRDQVPSKMFLECIVCCFRSEQQSLLIIILVDSCASSCVVFCDECVFLCRMDTFC